MSRIRIQGGEAGSRFIKSMKDNYPVRPLLGRIKKSLFDILRPRLEGSLFLDLYSGTGAVGLEALSRGAQRAVFVDGDARCVRMIKDNIATFHWEGRAVVHQADILRGLGWLSEKFDIVFLGPPYVDQEKRPLALTTPTLFRIQEGALLKPDGWVISQHHAKEPVAAPEGLVSFRREKYGDTVVTFYRKEN